MIVRPLGQITSIDAASIDAAYPSGNGGGILGTKEILRATTVRIDNQSDTYDMIIKPAETAYVSKRPTATVLDDPNIPTYVEIPPAPAETIQIRLAPGIAQGAATGFIYASPVSTTG